MAGKNSVPKIVFSVVIIAGVIWWKFSAQGKADKEAHEELKHIVTQVSNFAGNQAYYGQLADYAHPIAFKRDYSMGGRRQAAKFDAESYLIDAFDLMIQKAKQDRRKEIADALDKFRHEKGFIERIMQGQ